MRRLERVAELDAGVVMTRPGRLKAGAVKSAKV
jgi:hypothetical protein